MIMKTKCTRSEVNSEYENCGGEVYTHNCGRDRVFHVTMKKLNFHFLFSQWDSWVLVKCGAVWHFFLFCSLSS